jgi:hypothetical protein
MATIKRRFIMNRTKKKILLLVAFLEVGSIPVFGKPFAVGPYLGQTPPGSTAQVGQSLTFRTMAVMAGIRNQKILHFFSICLVRNVPSNENTPKDKARGMSQYGSALLERRPGYGLQQTHVSETSRCQCTGSDSSAAHNRPSLGVPIGRD